MPDYGAEFDSLVAPQAKPVDYGTEFDALTAKNPAKDYGAEFDALKNVNPFQLDQPISGSTKLVLSDTANQPFARNSDELAFKNEQARQVGVKFFNDPNYGRNQGQTVGETLTAGLPFKALKPSAQTVQDAMDTLESIGPGRSLSDPSRPPGTAAKAYAGVIGAGLGVPETMSSPLGVATFFTGGAPAWLQRLISAGFTVDMLRNVPEQVKKFADAYNKKDTEGVVEAGGDLLMTAGFIGASAKHAGTSNKSRMSQDLARELFASDVQQPTKTQQAAPIEARDTGVVSSAPETLVRPLSSRTGLRDRLQPIENPNANRQSPSVQLLEEKPAGSVPPNAEGASSAAQELAGTLPQEAQVVPIAGAKADPKPEGTVGAAAAPAPIQSGWRPEIKGWTARVNSYFDGDRKLSDVLELAKAGPENAVWHLRNAARIAGDESIPGFDKQKEARLLKLANTVEDKLMNVSRGDLNTAPAPTTKSEPISSKLVDGASKATAPEPTEPIPGEKLMTVQRPDGTTYKVSFSDKYWDDAKTMPSVARLTPEGQWSHGMLKKGEKFVEESKAPEPPKAVEPVGTTKEPWQMTRDEYHVYNAESIIADYESGGSERRGYGATEKLKPMSDADKADIRSDREFSDRNRKSTIESALREGKPVPPEVLADYPDLAKQSKTAAPEKYDLQQIGATSGEWKTVQTYGSKADAEKALPKGSGWRLVKSEKPIEPEFIQSAKRTPSNTSKWPKFPKKEGYEVVFKPYGPEGSGYYYEPIKSPIRQNIDVSNDKFIGQNAAGEKLYERADGSTYRMRNDRKDRPNGYPDFGGDLAQVSPSEKPLKIGDPIRVMGVDSVLAKTETIDGMRYELFNGAKLSENRATIRVTDLDSGKVSTLKQHPNYDGAESEYNNSIEAAKSSSEKWESVEVGRFKDESSAEKEMEKNVNNRSYRKVGNDYVVFEDRPISESQPVETPANPQPATIKSESEQFISDLNSLTDQANTRKNPSGSVTLQFPLSKEREVGELLRQYGMKVRNNGYSEDFKQAEWEIQPGGTGKELLPAAQRLSKVHSNLKEAEANTARIDADAREAQIQHEESRLRNLATGKRDQATSALSKETRESLTDSDKQRLAIAAAKPAEPRKQSTIPEQKYQLKGSGPQTHELISRLPASEVEIANGEQPVRVRNDRTGKESTVLESDLVPIKPSTGEKRAKIDLDQELTDRKLDPSVFPTAKAKRAAIERHDAINRSAGDKAKKLADKFREQFKTPLSQKELGTFGVATKIINAAVELGAKAIELSGKIVDGINTAIAFIRSNHEGDFDESGLRAHLEERFTQDEPIPSDTTQVSGKDVGILSKTVAPDAASQIAYTEKAFSDYGIPVKLVQKIDPRQAGDPIKTQFRFEPDGFNYDVEATKLADDLEAELAKGDHANNLKLSNLTTSIANSIADGEASVIGEDGRPMLSAAVQERLFNLAQTPASQAGQVLSQRGLHSFDPNGELQMARNVDVNLRKVWRDSTGGGEHVTPLMQKLLETFRSFFTPEEIKSALDPLNLPAAVDRLIQLNQKDSGSRVYRQVQARLKAKVPKTAEQKNRKAIEDEAVEAIIRHAAELGQIEPSKLPNQKLTPDQQLELVSKPDVAAKIQQATEQAVKDAEYNAGWKAEENAAKTPEEKADVEARKAAGEEPSPEMIQEGLKLKEYQHWKALRDELLNYSPTTVKLVQDVIAGRFKGARFKPTETKPEDFRIDFKKLAVAPETEVQRVFDAQTAEVKDLLKGATPETVSRVSQLFRDNIAEQLKQRRAEVVDRMFSERRPTGKESPDEIAAIKKQINAGLLRDQRLSDEELLQRAANKSVIRDLLPNTEDLVKRILESPRYNLKDIKSDVAAELVKKIGLTDEQAKNLSELIYRSLDGTADNPGPLRRASENALKKVQAELAPEEKPIFAKGKALWQKIERGVRAGLFDSGPVLEDLARSENWTIPTPAEKAQMKAWAEEEMRLRTPTQRQLDKHGGNVERATADAEAATEQERIALIKKIQANWSRWTMPIGLRNMFSKEIAQNNAKAVNEVVAANLLAKGGFFIRQGLDVGLVSMPLNAVNRSLVHALERGEASGGFSGKDLDAATREMMVARVTSIRATIRQMERTATGHSNRKVVDRMTHSIGIFDRAIAKADSLESQGNIAAARALRLATLLRAGYRVAETWDAVQSVGLEWQEMRQQLSTDLRKAGKTHADIVLTLDDIFGKMKVDMLEATREAEAIGLERGLTKDKKTLESDAWRLVKAKAYDRMREAAGTKTDYAEENKQLQELHSWNLPETGGVGGVIAETIKTIKLKTEKAGVPTGGLFSFGNAMGIAANRMMTFSGMGLFGGFGFGDSPWYKGAREIRQRRIEAIEGLSVIGLVIALAAAGKIIVQTKYPSDKGEKEKFIAQGHKLNTVRWNNDDGSWIEYPIQMSPFSFIASPLYMIGGVQQLFTDKQKAQAKLNADALKNGTTPGQVPGVGAHDVLSVVAQGMYGMLTGGRTASGAIQSFSDYGNFNLNKAAAATVAPYLPGIPAWQEASRAMGVAMDTKTASVFELLVPMPGSAHQRVNALGDPLVNQNDAVRILQVMSGGIGFGNDQDLKDNHAYRQVFDSGYSIPEISRNKGYNFNGSIRHMTAQELDKYAIARGQALKEELAGVNVAGLPEAEAKKLVQGAFQRANNRALTAVGVTVPVSRATTATAGRTRSTSRLRLGSRRSRGGLRSLRGSRSKLRSGFGKRRRRKFSLV